MSGAVTSPPSLALASPAAAAGAVEASAPPFFPPVHRGHLQWQLHHCPQRAHP